MTHASRLADLPTWLLSQASARAHKLLHEQLMQAGASGYEYRVLAALGDGEGVSQADLGRAAGLDPHDVTHTVRALQARRLVARRPDERDARRLLVALTAAGRRTLSDLDALVQRVQGEVLAPLTDAERRAFVDLLRRLA